VHPWFSMVELTITAEPVTEHGLTVGSVVL
jgi:hypothetical protein